MLERGLTRSEVLVLLRRILQNDFTYGSGRILGSMCTNPPELAKTVYRACIEKNLGDPDLFPGVAELEEEVVEMMGALLSNPSASGQIVSGGTEANILALWAARNLAKKERPEVIIPLSAHFSFDKAADLLGLRLVKVRLNKQFQVDVKAVEEAITDQTIAIVGSVGTTELGAVDSIAQLSEIALQHSLYLHVDAAFGGFIIPFLKDLDYDAPDFDFKLSGVSSITMDPHKMGLAPIPAGGILFRDNVIPRAIGTRVPYLLEGKSLQACIVGTRSGASVAATWSILKHLGRNGFRKIVGKCMRLTQNLVEGVQGLRHMRVVAQPTMNIVGLTSKNFKAKSFAAKLRKRGWAVTPFTNHVRIVLMPHLRPIDIAEFLEDLRETL